MTNIQKNRATERHHFIPQFYLRYWCGEDSKLLAYPVTGAPAFATSPKNVAAIKGLHHAGSFEHLRDFDYEGRLSSIEGLFSARWPDIFQRSKNPKTKQNLSSFLALMHLRHPNRFADIGEINRRYRELTAGCEDHETIRILHRKSAGRALKVKDIRDGARDDEATRKEAFLRLMRTVLEPLAAILMKRKWGVVISREPIFITSDSPLVIWRGNALSQNIGFETPGTQITFPLTPYQMLVINDEYEHDGMVYPLIDDANLNNGVIDSATRFVFAWKDLPGLSKRIRSVRRLSGREPRPFILEEGWHSILSP